MTACVQFHVPGIPQSKGSMRAFVIKGRAVLTSTNKRAKGWAHEVRAVAAEAMHRNPPTREAVTVTLEFRLQRPRSHYRTGRHAAELRADAPESHTARTGDIDKLARCALDALTGVVYEDDSQVDAMAVRKRYGEPGLSVFAEWVEVEKED